MTTDLAYRCVGVFMLLGALAPMNAAQAEPAAHPGRPLVLNADHAPAARHGKTAKPVSAKAVKQAETSDAAGKPAAKASPNGRADAHPAKPPHAVSTKEPSVPLGRIPLQTGTFGFDASTKMKSREFPNGEQLPGYKPLEREGGIPFIGLSLSVPTSSIPGFSAPSRSGAD
jgi:hypothetical protein